MVEVYTIELHNIIDSCCKRTNSVCKSYIYFHSLIKTKSN